MTPETLLQISTAILFLPLLGFVILIFWGKKLGDKLSAGIGTTILGIDLLLSIIVAIVKMTQYGHVEGMLQWKLLWFTLGSKDIVFGLGMDNLTVIMLIVVNLISFLVHVFSLEYMKGDKRFPRFYAYLGIFTFSMLGIVLANNFLNMYIFWELVGLSSYLLIGFWYEKDSAANAGKKAFITNRIGDFGFFFGIMLVFFTYNTFMFDEIFEQVGMGVLPFDSGTWLTAAGILLFCGAIGKSAQFPLHVWLPDAMEGPTPVSALIHAATMVAAGVYLTARIFPMLTADALLFVAYIGAITAFMAATIAITQNDFKKVLAYSTVSQLGYMVMAIGVGAFTTGFFHLVTHAWFKACLFLASGSVIHAMHESMHRAHNHSMDAQDIRNMGGLRKTMPLTYATFLMATLAISGVPFTSGFLSKDGILAGTLAFANLSGHWLIPIAGFGAAGITAFYMFRLGIQAFHGKPKTDIAIDTAENKKVVTMPLVLLAVMSLFVFYSYNPIDANVGWFTKMTKAPATVVPAELQFDFLMPADSHGDEHGESLAMKDEHGHAAQSSEAHEEGTPHFEESAAAVHGEEESSAQHAGTHFEHEMHAMHYPAMIASLIIAGLGILLAFTFYQFKIFDADSIARQIDFAYKFSLNKWYFDELYEKTIIWLTIAISKVSSYFDLWVIDGIVNMVGNINKGISWLIGMFDNIVIDGLVNLSANMVGFFGIVVRKVQVGRIQTYLVYVILGIVLITIFVL